MCLHGLDSLYEHTHVYVQQKVVCGFVWMVWTVLCEHTHAYVQLLEQFITLMDEGQVGCSPAFCRGSVWGLFLHIQWSHMFLLIEDQGGQGYELFFKTRELKKKWMEQFEMAMWVSFSFVHSPHHKINSNNELKTKDKNEKPRTIAATTNEKQKDKNKEPRPHHLSPLSFPSFSTLSSSVLGFLLHVHTPLPLSHLFLSFYLLLFLCLLLYLLFILLRWKLRSKSQTSCSYLNTCETCNYHLLAQNPFTILRGDPVPL